MLSGNREECSTSRSCAAGTRRANSRARAKGVNSLRNRAMRISGRTDHLEWWHTALTNAADAPGRSNAVTSADSTRREFSKAVCQTRDSRSSSSAAATLPDERRASEMRSPRLMEASRATSNSSATRFRSAATAGSNENCMRSKVYSSRIRRKTMRRGARGWAASARRTLRDFITAELLLICPMTSEASSRFSNLARATSAVKTSPSSAGDAWPAVESGATKDSSEFCNSELITCPASIFVQQIQERSSHTPFAPYAALPRLDRQPPDLLPLATPACEVHCKKPGARAAHNERRLRSWPPGLRECGPSRTAAG